MTTDATRLRLGIDIDDVLADFRSAFQLIASECLGEAIDVVNSPQQLNLDSLTSPQLRRVWKLIVSTPNWWTTLPPFEPEQIKRLYRLARKLKWEVYFLTKRPTTAGDPVQFQSQWWLEEQGFFLPSVMSVSGSRGELANALRLDLVIDDQMLNCIEVISSSFAKSVLLLRDEGQDEALKNAQARGIGVVSTLEQAIDVAERLQELLQDQRGALERVTDWFPWSKAEAPALPLNPREIHRLPPDE